MTDAKVVETNSGKEVRMPYRTGCRNYAIGVASAFFMAATVLGFVILWRHHVPEAVYHTVIPFFLVYSLAGFIIVGVAYTNPIWFYETLEERGES